MMEGENRFIHLLNKASRAAALSNEGEKKWQELLIEMSTGDHEEEGAMTFSFGSDAHGHGHGGHGDLNWNHLTLERAVEMIYHLPPSIEGLIIDASPYGIPFMDAVIDWIKHSSNNLECLIISNTCHGMGGTDGGRDAGVRLAEALVLASSKNDTLEILNFYETDLIGSRNVDEWTEALGMMKSLKVLGCCGMLGVKDHGSAVMLDRAVDESTLDSNSTVQFPVDGRQRIYWKDGIFPDAHLTEEDVEILEGATQAEIRVFYKMLNTSQVRAWKK